MSEQRPSNQNVPLAPFLAFFGGIALILAALLVSTPASVRTGAGTATPVVAISHTAAPASATPQQVALASSSALDPQKVAAGEKIFQSVCFACHGFNAKGIPGLGKPLIGSQFFNSHTDDEMVAFLQVGRPVTDPLNTTGVQMPPRGGNASLTDDDLRNVIAYIRSLNLPSGTTVAAAPTSTTPEPTLPPAVFDPNAISSLLGTSNTSAATETPVAPTEVATSDVSAVTETPVVPTEAAATSAPTEVAMASSSGLPIPGQADYIRACSGCHGVDGKGVPYITQPLADSDLVKTQNGMGILGLFNVAQPPVNPDVKFQHPYRGGYPELTDDQLLSIVSYLMTLPR